MFFGEFRIESELFGGRYEGRLCPDALADAFDELKFFHHGLRTVSVIRSIRTGFPR